MIGTLSHEPNLPDPPLDRILVQSHIVGCINCGSTTHRIGFLGILGKKVCDNSKCKNAK